ncbi:hypothetical protein [Rhodococcus erythropolis]|uniref:hypothetical protein n=1 Tax=Rhodococcus erythropolis TaxID=1833 RepID=UPI00366F99CA
MTARHACADAYFDDCAQELLALHILAASRIYGDLLCTSQPGSATKSIPSLRKSCALPPLIGRPRIEAARRIDDAGLNPCQRDGLFDMAAAFLNVLSGDEYAYVITRGSAPSPSRKRTAPSPSNTDDRVASAVRHRFLVKSGGMFFSGDQLLVPLIGVLDEARAAAPHGIRFRAVNAQGTKAEVDPQMSTSGNNSPTSLELHFS